MIHVPAFILLLSSFAWSANNALVETHIKTIYERPKVYGKSVPFNSLTTNKPKVQQKITTIHNHYRSIVKPKAANMLRLKWNKKAAMAAHKWAHECKLLQHDNGTMRTFKNVGLCGQNIFVSSQKVPWLFAIKSWFSEREDFVYGRQNQTGVTGHYTQMVWATSHQVGCGIAKCKHKYYSSKVFYNYVCDYCPTGNIKRVVSQPYVRSKKSCSACAGYCKGNLCTNSCPFTNKYSNCDSLAQSYPNICSSMRSSCKATCLCRNKIFQRYH